MLFKHYDNNSGSLCATEEFGKRRFRLSLETCESLLRMYKYINIYTHMMYKIYIRHALDDATMCIRTIKGSINVFN